MTYESFKELVRQADAKRDYKRLEALEAMNPRMYDDARGELALESEFAYIEAQEDRKDWDFSRPIEL